MTTTQLLTYTAVTGAIAAILGVLLIAFNGWDVNIIILLGLGAFFVLFYTWPLKYIALGELAVLIVWGPLMIGGGYYVLAGKWDWNVVWASLPYVFGVTTVIFGKHIDKLKADKEKKIHTLPVLIGETNARYAILSMMVLSYIFVLALIFSRYFTPIMLIVFLAVPTFLKVYPAAIKTKTGNPSGRIPGWTGRLAIIFCPPCVLEQSFIWHGFYVGFDPRHGHSHFITGLLAIR